MKIVFKEYYLERPQPIILRPNTKLESCKRSKINYIPTVPASPKGSSIEIANVRKINYLPTTPSEKTTV